MLNKERAGSRVLYSLKIKKKSLILPSLAPPLRGPVLSDVSSLFSCIVPRSDCVFDK